MPKLSLFADVRTDCTDDIPSPSLERTVQLQLAFGYLQRHPEADPAEPPKAKTMNGDEPASAGGGQRLGDADRYGHIAAAPLVCPTDATSMPRPRAVWLADASVGQLYWPLRWSANGHVGCAANGPDPRDSLARIRARVCAAAKRKEDPPTSHAALPGRPVAHEPEMPPQLRRLGKCAGWIFQPL